MRAALLPLFHRAGLPARSRFSNATVRIVRKECCESLMDSGFGNGEKGMGSRLPWEQLQQAEALHVQSLPLVFARRMAFSMLPCLKAKCLEIHLMRFGVSLGELVELVCFQRIKVLCLLCSRPSD